ncbi:MAG TPA: SUMF1/EgtB/PvdO family nonheme iron enzyme [Roseiflexaceae bacterium]|nr:SUMF1/EgtB/PvdO family nonheme iron enzyme [Roseiflexaceae bacterium]
MINRILGQYRIIEPIRQGGMSTVYKAYQESLDRFVAIKVLSHNHDPQFAARFKREARAIAQLQHPNILPIYDYGEQDGLLYLVMQYIENGTTLADMLDGPIEAARALRLIGKVLDALSYAHERGIIHRDIKPANVLLPSPEWPMLADFGIVKLRDDDQKLTIPGLVIGTAAYMAPEQASGLPVDARTDLYATGVVLYELITGRVPFDASTPMAMLAKHAYEPPVPPRDIIPALSTEVETLLLRALEKDPAARYQSAADMSAACTQAAARIQRSAAAQLAELYNEGLRALEEGRLDVAIARLEQVIAINPGYQDSVALLDVARSTQLRTRTEARQQLEQVRQRRSTQHEQLTSPPPPQPVAAPSAPTGPSQPSAAPAATPAVPQPARPKPAPSPVVPASPAPAPQPLWVRQRVPLIIGAVLLVLALLVLALIPFLRGGPQTAGIPTVAPQPTAINALQPTAANAPTAAGEPTAASEPTAESAPTALPPLPAPAGELAFEDDFSAGAQMSGLVGQNLAPDLALAVEPDGFYSMQLSQPNQSRAVLLPRFAASDFSAQIELSDGSSDATGSAAGGLIFRARDNEHFYALLIDTRKGEYTLRKQDGKDNSTDLIVPTASPLIQQGDGLNQLRIDAAGSTFTLYLNGAELASASDDSFSFGMVGTIVANADAATSTMRFDNLKLWSNDPPSAASTLPVTRQSLSGDMVLIPGGEFVIGSNDNANDLPQIIAQPDFYIDAKEVTNLAYLTCVDVLGCTLPSSLDSATVKGYVTAPDHNFYPIINVTWEQANSFCEKNGKRLPTEVEWEKAASWNATAHMKVLWPWGDAFDPARLNSTEGGRGDTVAVGTFPINLYNTFEMAGNVAEWTLSLVKPYPYDPADGREDLKAAGDRVVRGGSWSQPQEHATTSARQAASPTSTNNTIGFRCAATP